MRNPKGNTCVPGVLLVAAVVIAALTNGGCSATAEQACNSLGASAKASVTAYSGAVSKLQTTAATVEAKWLAVCNEMNTDLGLDATQTTADKACQVLKAYISNDLSAGVTISVDVPFTCSVDSNAQASCQATCTASANCDLKASCQPGQLVVQCMGTCDAECDVTGPSVTCNGECDGSCSVSASGSCSGSCSGMCTLPMWTGTCDAGCTASFSGSCGGMCMGSCDGNSSSGTCAGKCVGTCSAMATGSCQAACTGNFSGGNCDGGCTGSCAVTAMAMCNGTCNGTCKYTQPMAMCTGTCHGNCSAAASPPSCEGTLMCNAAAQCSADCQSQASLNVNCPAPQATVTIAGDDKLATSYNTHLTELADAVNLTAMLAPASANVIGEAGKRRRHVRGRRRGVPDEPGAGRARHPGQHQRVRLGERNRQSAIAALSPRAPRRGFRASR